MDRRTGKSIYHVGTLRTTGRNRDTRYRIRWTYVRSRSEESTDSLRSFALQQEPATDSRETFSFLDRRSLRGLRDPHNSSKQYSTRWNKCSQGAIPQRKDIHRLSMHEPDRRIEQVRMEFRSTQRIPGSTSEETRPRSGRTSLPGDDKAGLTDRTKGLRRRNNGYNKQRY